MLTATPKMKLLNEHDSAVSSAVPPSERGESIYNFNLTGKPVLGNLANKLDEEPTTAPAPAAEQQKPQEKKGKDGDDAPTPYLKIYLIGMMLLVNNFSVFVIPTFLPFMIQDFFPDKPYDQLGLEVGLLASAFNFGQFVSGYVWGSAADRIGRRPVLILGLFGTLLGITVFGFAPSYYVALLARLVWGVLNGNVPVAKTYLSEVCDEKSQAKGFAVIGTAQSVGRLIGPIAGGYLAQPALKYPQVFDPNGIFGRFKYLLPMLVGIFFCVVTIPFSFIHLTESLPEDKKVKFKETKEKKKKDSAGGGSMVRLMLDNPTIGKAASLFVFISFISTFLEELLSLWLANTVVNGGFGLGSSQIGLMLTLSSPVPLVFQSFFFAPCVVYMGYKLVFLRSMVLAGIMAFILPFSSMVFRITGNYDGSFAFLTVAFSLFLIGRFYAFAAVYALINNSCDSQRGAVNGFSQSIAAGSRIIAAAVGTTLLTGTSGISNGVTDYHLVFNITLVLSLITAYIDYTLPDSINSKPKKEGKPSSKVPAAATIIPAGDSRMGGLYVEGQSSSGNELAAQSQIPAPSRGSHGKTDEVGKGVGVAVELGQVQGASGKPRPTTFAKHDSTTADEKEREEKENSKPKVRMLKGQISSSMPIQPSATFQAASKPEEEGGDGDDDDDEDFKEDDFGAAQDNKNPWRRNPQYAKSVGGAPSAGKGRLFSRPFFSPKQEKKVVRESLLYMRQSQMDL